ncbi:MAG TPA: c-type cytochrome [Burkholderiales bacterium]|nr:c-type cytochrome [Burkholderiales bacterium]
MKLSSRLASIALVMSVDGLGFAGLDAALAATQQGNPMSGNPEAIAGGKKLFNTWCAQCHGSKAEGGKYGANLKVFSKGYKEFLATVRDGRVQKMMPPWKDVLGDGSINEIGAYLETLAEPGANWK